MKSSETIRVVKKNKFSILSNALLRDNRMSFEARGALGYVLSKPNDWQVTVADLEREGGVGRDAIYAILKEWTLHGYFSRTRNSAGSGQFDWESTVYDEPQQRQEDPDASNARHVMLCQCGPFYKVAVVSDITTALSFIQKGNPYQIVVRKVIDAGSPDQANTLEGLMFDRFKGSRKGGEWFRLTPTQVREALVTLDPLPELPYMVLPNTAEPHPLFQQAVLPDTVEPPAAIPDVNQIKSTEIPKTNTGEKKESTTKRGLRRAPELVTKRQFEAAIKRIWERWQNRFRDVIDVGQYKLNDERIAMINDRLRSPKCHWTERDCIMGIEGLRLSKWHMGDNPDHRKYLDIKYIFQDDSTLEKRVIDYREYEKRMDDRKAIETAKQVAQNCQFCKGTGSVMKKPTVPGELTPVPEQVWVNLLADVKTKLTPESYETWFKPVTCEGVNCERVFLAAPNQTIRDWLQVNYGTVLREAIATAFARDFEIAWLSDEKIACDHKGNN